jgi:hypothetical protein
MEQATVGDEHVADTIRMADEHHRLAGDAKAGDVAEVAYEPVEQGERPSDDGERELSRVPLARSRNGTEAAAPTTRRGRRGG